MVEVFMFDLALMMLASAVTGGAVVFGGFLWIEIVNRKARRAAHASIRPRL